MEPKGWSLAHPKHKAKTLSYAVTKEMSHTHCLSGLETKPLLSSVQPPSELAFCLMLDCNLLGPAGKTPLSYLISEHQDNREG